MLDWLKHDNSCHRQNCFKLEFPNESQQLTTVTSDYFALVHKDENIPKITQFFKEKVENCKDVNPITEEKKKEIIGKYTATCVDAICVSPEYENIFRSILKQNEDKEATSEELEDAIKGYVQFEANFYTIVPTICLNQAIESMERDKPVEILAASEIAGEKAKKGLPSIPQRVQQFFSKSLEKVSSKK